MSFLLHLFLAVSLVSGSVKLSDLPANTHYTNLRSPLTPSVLQKLPVGCVRGEGWLKVELDLQRNGFAGRLSEISHFLDIKNNAWMGNGKADRAGWEELPYWLRGQVSLGFVTGDKKIIDQCTAWIEGVLKSQQLDGWFGPLSNRDTKLGTPDLWPNMLMQDVLQTYYEATQDKRVLTLMSRYCDYLTSLDDKSLIDPRHYWHYHRVADQLASLVWLYNRTGDRKILSLATRLHHASSDWTTGIPNFHGVNFAQGFREPATYSLFSNKGADYDASVNDLIEFRKMFGQFPGGMYAADENARKGFNDPRQATESCAIAEMMFSDELLMLYSGDPAWANKLEEVAFNEMPVTMTSDLKALRYLQSANMAVSDSPSKSPGVENGGPMFLMDPNDHRCCQHNVGMGWPYFTEHLWTATNGNGLAAMVLSPCKVTAKVGKDSTVTITETTDYPFDETVSFHVSPSRPTRFPLTLRIPGWCGKPELRVNGTSIKTGSSGLVTVLRRWVAGDKVVLKLPMTTVKRSWPQRPGAIAVSRGPLFFSLKIDEETKRLDRPSGWPAYEIHPKTAWNYGLEPNTTLNVVKSKLRPGDQPFDLANVPVRIVVKGRRIPEWTLDMYGLVSPLQRSPARTAEPVESLTLVPMGAARLRISVFPTVSTEPIGTTWKPARQSKPGIATTYSYRNWFDSERALSDGLLPESSSDETVPRFTWWDHKGTEEWVQYTFPSTKTFQHCRIYWFDDAPTGGCRAPKSWRIQVKQGDNWCDVETPSGYGTMTSLWNDVTFQPIGGKEIRIVVQLREGYSSGVLEWEVD